MKKVSYDYENRYPIVEDGEEKEMISLARIEHLVADSDLDSKMSIFEEEAVGEIAVEEVEDEETEPTQLDQIEAQVTYTAMMTDTLLEE